MDLQIFFSHILSFLLMVFFFGFAVFIHELGHLLVAMKCGLHVERFSVGFGKTFFKWKFRGVECWLSMIPFGGYVALPQMEPTDTPKSYDDKDLPHAKPIPRILVAFAGPLFNIILGFILATIIWQIGTEQPVRETSITVGTIPKTYMDLDKKEQKNPEHVAGLEVGDVITHVNGQKITRGFYGNMDYFIFAEDSLINLSVERGGEKLNIKYTTAKNPKLEGVGYPLFEPYKKTYVGGVSPESAIEKAGVKKGDLFLEINGEKVQNPSWAHSKLTDTIKGVKKDSDLNDVVMKMQREDGTVYDVTLQAKFMSIEYFTHMGLNKQKVEGYKYGVGFSPKFKLYHDTPLYQFENALLKTYYSLRSIVNPKSHIGIKHMSGPVGIGHGMARMFNIGFMQGLIMVTIINFSLAFFNLLPLPVLDGGHITLATMELVSRKRVSERFVRPVFYAFVMMLITFALFVTYNDVLRFFR
ncbi:MAG: site-2 protease family protein [Lentisphaeria bacterium]|nr:site-2 protease family protein [Lentisphaeria bacterium]